MASHETDFCNNETFSFSWIILRSNTSISLRAAR